MNGFFKSSIATLGLLSVSLSAASSAPLLMEGKTTLYQRVLTTPSCRLKSDANAKDGDEFTVEHEGYFLASSAVEDGVVEKSFLPDGAMKRLIKDDAATEAA